MSILKKVEACPWCKGNQRTIMFSREENDVIKCNSCGLVYSDTILSEQGLQLFWKDYESKVHSADKELTEQRKQMYKLDFEFIKPFLRNNSIVLDVGSGDGSFLDEFNKYGCICEGTEFGEEAYAKSNERYPMYFGELADIGLYKKYDVILLRGTIQYLLKPRESLRRAVDLLNQDGLIFIGMINSDSICFNLFKDMFRLPVTPTDYYMFNEHLVTSFMTSLGMRLVSEKMPYLGTPYENWKQDILEVAEAIKKNMIRKNIIKKSTSFFDTMINIIYKKI